MARKKIIAGNWKMNKTPSEAVALVNELKPLVANDEVDVVFCVPAIDIIPCMEAAKGSNIQIGQKLHIGHGSAGIIGGGQFRNDLSIAMQTLHGGIRKIVLHQRPQGHANCQDRNKQQ